MHTLPLLTQQFAELSPFFYSRVSPEPLTAPYWVAFNTDLAAELNLDTDFQTTANLAYLSGNAPQYAPAPVFTADISSASIPRVLATDEQS